MEQLQRDKGKGNVLCNGPRRKYFTPNGLYTIGCNFPPIPVDATCIVDRNVIRSWVEGKVEMLTKNFVLTRAAIETLNEKPSKEFISRPENAISILGHFNLARNYYSSGHWAAFAMIRLGYTELDIYGCDSFWEMNIGSYTDNFIEKGKPLHNPKFATEWRKSWHRLSREEGKGVKFNFINEIKENGEVISESIYVDRKTRLDP